MGQKRGKAYVKFLPLGTVYYVDGSQQLHHRLKAKQRSKQVGSDPGHATVEQVAGSRRHLARCFRGCF